MNVYKPILYTQNKTAEFILKYARNYLIDEIDQKRVHLHGLYRILRGILSGDKTNFLGLSFFR